MPIESAAYFAISELLANASKHAQHARQGGRSPWHTAGSASSRRCTWVRTSGSAPGWPGIERRLAAFDGVLAPSSPPGGPTVVNMEIPCALSSPKTFSC